MNLASTAYPAQAPESPAVRQEQRIVALSLALSLFITLGACFAAMVGVTAR